MLTATMMKAIIIFKATCPVFEGDTPEDLASRVHELEYIHFPVVIEDLVSKLP
jgi:phosphoribosylglycinamide formyltransferase-1